MPLSTQVNLMGLPARGGPGLGVSGATQTREFLSYEQQ